MLILMAIAMEAGRRLGVNELKRNPESAGKGTGAIEGAIFALFGLLLAFTFSGAASRFEHRRDLVVHEVNAIGTAYLRLDLLRTPDQAKLKPMFLNYVESRLKTYQLISEGLDVAMAEFAHSQELQKQIWIMAAAGSAKTDNPVVMSLVLSPINEMIDITTTRLAASRAHPPLAIYGLLFAFAIAIALLAGYSASFSREPHWLHKVLFSLCIAGTIYTTLDLEYPRLGLIRSDNMDLHFIELLHSIKPLSVNSRHPPIQLVAHNHTIVSAIYCKGRLL